MVYKRTPKNKFDAHQVLNKLLSIGFTKARIARMMGVGTIHLYRWLKPDDITPSDYYHGLFRKLAEYYAEYRCDDPIAWCDNIERRFKSYLREPINTLNKKELLSDRDYSSDNIYARHCAELTKVITWCELCGSTSKTLEFHHIYYRSEVSSHKSKHHKKNLIRLCRDCHNEMHNKKYIRDLLVKDRKLDLLFKQKDVGTASNQTIESLVNGESVGGDESLGR